MATKWLLVAEVIRAFGIKVPKDIKYYEHGWDDTTYLQFEIFPIEDSSSYMINLLGIRKIM